MAANDHLESFASEPVGGEVVMVRRRSKRGEPKATQPRSARTTSSQMHYLPSSALSPVDAPKHIVTPQLERWLAMKSRVDKATPFRTIHLLQLSQRTRPYEDVQSLVGDVRAFARELHALGLDALVIDTLSDLNRGQRDSFIYAVTHVWLSGIDVVIADTNNQCVSFNDMSEVVNGQDFIRTYINSIWKEERERKRHRRHSEPRVTRSVKP